jgi:glutaredoxin
MKEAEPNADVIMYCTEWCPSCRLARAFLERHGIPYAEIDISKDRTAAKLVRGWANGNETTPTFNIRGTIVVDWEQKKVAELLGL